VCVCLAVHSMAIDQNRRHTRAHFNGGEHWKLGDAAWAAFAASAGSKLPPNVYPVRWGTSQLSWGQIIMLTGDIYATSGSVSDGGNQQKGQCSSLAAKPLTTDDMKFGTGEFGRIYDRFNTEFTTNGGKEAAKFLAWVNNEVVAIDKQLATNNPNAGVDAYKSIDATHGQIGEDRISQGRKTASTFGGKLQGIDDQMHVVFKSGPFLQLALTNYDHFSPCNQRAYAIGHALALQQAAQAKATNDVKKLELAMKYEAMSHHFLTDAFSGGHIRVNRQLPVWMCGLKLGSLMVKSMHDEDSFFGVAVTNLNGQKWIAFGDGRYNDRRNTKNREIAQTAVLASLNELLDAYTTGHTGLPAEFKALRIVPFADPTNTEHPPLLMAEGQVLKYRKKAGGYDQLKKIGCILRAAELHLRAESELKKSTLENGKPPFDVA